MKPQFHAVKGTRDILPPDSALWNQVEQTARLTFATYNFHEVRLPLFEETELFARSVGADTDIVQKEMYTFTDVPEEHAKLISEIQQLEASGEFKEAEIARRDLRPAIGRDLGRGRLIALRPEATASVVRAYIEHGLHTRPGLNRFYYIGPMFRRERPQKGRFRQFYQIGAEILGGSDHPAIDAEIIELVLVFIERCGLAGCALFLNSIGCSACRPNYVELLRKQLRKVEDKLGPDSQRRIDTNPLRVLDSKVEGEQAIIEKLPSILDHLCDACRQHFESVKQELNDRGLAFQLNPRLVRGLDYYVRTTFEITAPGLGAQNAICGGGRYDGLVELLGGPPTKGTGWALGTDRFLLALAQAGAGQAELRLDVFVVWLGAPAYARARELARRLRDAGLSVELPYDEMKLKKALGRANQLRARYTIIIGEDELKQGKFTLREMKTGTQHALLEAELLRELTRGAQPE